MSGRKQHFIPQSLLKGFGRAVKGAKVQVVAYTYERGIFTAATDGIGAEREFYSKLAIEGEGETLDDKITAYETSLGDIIDGLRNLGNGEAADTRMASELVTHLVIRNDHLRKFMSSAGTALFGGFADVMVDESQAKTLLGLGGEKPSAMFADELDKAFAEYGPMIAMLGMSREQFAEWAFQYSKANFAGFHAQITGPLQRALAETTGKVAETAADAQRRSLNETLSPEPRIEKMAEYDWHVVHPPVSIVLPDCVAVAFDANGEAFPLVFADLDEAKTIHVPMSSDRLLVGAKESADLPANLNDVFASCSWDFFVAGDRTSELEGLRDNIRSRTARYMNDTIAGVLSDSLGKLSEDRQ